MRSDDDLMADPAGGAELVARYDDRLRRYFRHSLLDEHRAEDLAQETWTRVFRERERFRPQGRFRSWLFRIAHNLLVEAFADRFERNAGEPPDDRPSPPAAVLRDEAKRRVFEALRSLPPISREAVVLAFFAELPYAEIAEIAGTTAGAVAVRVHDGLTRLRDLLKESSGP